ncbi:MAG: hypothetical protein PWQ86_1183 [Bacillota bacterium]|nr:hypothetical protein [Bacillota bacterium]
MSGCICLDSSVLIKILVSEEGSEAAARLLETAVDYGLEVVLPSFAWVEVGSVLRQKIKNEAISTAEAEEAWEIFQSLRLITYLETAEIRQLAWKIFAEYDLPTFYDAAYLAVTEIASKGSKTKCEFWTADKKLFNAVKASKNYVRLLGQDEIDFEKPLKSTTHT